MRRRKRNQMINVLPIAVALLLLAVSAMAAGKAKPQHPELSAQEKLIACADCHREATPEIEKQWHNSVHGIAMVKCYECHGTFGDFRRDPEQADLRGLPCRHAQKMSAG